MKGLCPNCERETALEVVRGAQELNVRGEIITIELEYNKCTECESEFRDPRDKDDPLDRAYREYRQRKGMVQPETMKEMRNRYGLTQQELASLLGWGGATLSRYENGALQDEAHDTILKLIADPKNMLELLKERQDALSETKRRQLVAFCSHLIRGAGESPAARLEDTFGSYEPDEYSGYLALNINKVFNAMLYFCMDVDVPKTKLNKLLFYADFKHFKEYTVSITGAQYAHLPYGPAPDHYEMYFATLHDLEKAIQIEEREFPDYVGEYLRACKEPNLTAFTTTELKILATVKERFAVHTASAISKDSHEERGYQETTNGELISYNYAADLSI